MEQTKGNKLGTMPINKLLVNVSLPIVISMLVQALYNIVDSIFVSKISEDALAAVSLVFPIQNLIIAVAVGTGVGINSLLSRRLGEKNYDSANRVAANGLFLSFTNFLIFALIGIFLTKPFFSSSDIKPEIAEMGITYMRIICIGSLGVFGGITSERLLQGTGRSSLSMVSQLTGAITNIILDPLLIFGIGPFPELGVTGAALATIFGQWLGMIVGLLLNYTKNKELHIKLRQFKPNPKTIKHIYQVGLPSIIMQSIGSIMVYGMNMLLISFSDTAVSFFGVYLKLQSFVFMPVFGFNNGLVSIIAFNYGAKQKDRIITAIKSGLKICCSIMIVGMLVFMFAPKLLLNMFDNNENIMDIGVYALRIISISFPFAAVSIVFTGVFQALSLGVYSMIMSIVRQLIFLLPTAYILSRLWGLNAIWFAFPIAEIVCFFMAIFFFYRT